MSAQSGLRAVVDRQQHGVSGKPERRIFRNGWGTPLPSLARPPAIVLGLNVTGLATARALSEAGVSVHGVSVSRRDPGRGSRYCRVVRLDHLAEDEARLCEWLARYAGDIGGRPVILPTNDAFALLLARHRDRLQDACRIWDNREEHLEALVHKNSLYRLATAMGIAVPPALDSPNLSQIDRWCAEHPGPYLVKPYYTGGRNAPFADKNKVFTSAAELRRFFAELPGGIPCLVQRILQGGDGFVFDCYGLCDRHGRVRTMGSHRRIRQYPPNFGMTCYGEIPGVPDGWGEEALFHWTQRLLAGVKYHGIFGIEWLQDRETKQLYLLDFNARSFYTIGHLRDCGLNLPLAAYRELCGDELTDLPLTPPVRRLLWVDLVRDAGTFRHLRRQGQLGWFGWVASLVRCRSYATWNVRDPWPAVRSLFQLARDGCSARGKQ